LPTILVIHDTTPFRYLDPIDVTQALFGDDSVRVTSLADGTTQVSRPFFGRNAEFRPGKNDCISAVATFAVPLEMGGLMSLRLYLNPHARVDLGSGSFWGPPQRTSHGRQCAAEVPGSFPIEASRL